MVVTHYLPWRSSKYGKSTSPRFASDRHCCCSPAAAKPRQRHQAEKKWGGSKPRGEGGVGHLENGCILGHAMKNFGFTVGLAYFFFSYLNLSYFGLSYVILLYVLLSYLVYQYIPKDSLLVNGMGTHKLQIQSRSVGLPPFMDYLLGVCVCVCGRGSLWPGSYVHINICIYCFLFIYLICLYIYIMIYVCIYYSKK